MPSPLDAFRRESPLERYRRRREADPLSLYGLPTEEAEQRLSLPAPAGEEPGQNPLLRRVGLDIGSGIYGLAGLAASVGPLGLVQHATGVGPAPEFFRRADELQQSAGWGHPGGEARDEYLAYQLSQGASPTGAAVAETIGAIGGMADPTDVLGPVAGVLGAFRRPAQKLLREAVSPIGDLLGRLRRPAAEAAEQAAAPATREMLPGIQELAEKSLRIGGDLEEAVAPKVAGRVTFDAPVGRGETQTIAMRNEAGEEIGHIRVRPRQGGPGYDTDWIEIDPAYRRQGLSAQLYGEAERHFGPRLGATVAQTPAGEAAAKSFARRVPGPEDRLPYQYNLRERYDLSDEAAESWVEMMEEDAEAIARQRRAGTAPTKKELEESVESLAAANGWSTRKYLEMQPGTVLNREELYGLDAAVRRAGDRASIASRAVDAARSGGGGNLDQAKLQLAVAIYEQKALLARSVGASTELGRALESRKALARALADCFP